ncbi:DUF7389 domain-containing protein [Halorientalis halophila]|uniref:DUF7389 domain-containing protein n=1 Tax=Halorientalis halophila TaxID=3108499 RepID=UPI00300B1F87
MPEDAYSYTVKLKRSGGRDGQDVQKCKVSAPDIETLRERVNNVREEMAGWADDYRNIQPGEGHQLPDDQSDLSEVSA